VACAISLGRFYAQILAVVPVVSLPDVRFADGHPGLEKLAVDPFGAAAICLLAAALPVGPDAAFEFAAPRNRHWPSKGAWILARLLGGRWPTG
jgi:hypothetical protein